MHAEWNRLLRHATLLALLAVPLTACEQVQQQMQQVGINMTEMTNLVQLGMEALQPLPVAQEVMIGQEISAVLLGAAPLRRDEPLHEYVNRVGLWIADQSSRPDLPWRFGVLNTDSVNAFAAPGGNIFVTRGLLAILQSEAELAGVLAHEIVHVLERHHLNALRREKSIGLAAALSKHFSVTASASQHAQMLPAELKAKLGEAGRQLYATGLDRTDELAADRAGLQLAARAGYDPYALISVLQKLEALSAQDARLEYLFSTHPQPGKRIAELEKVLDGLAVPGPFAEGTARYQRYALKRI